MRETLHNTGRLALYAAVIVVVGVVGVVAGQLMRRQLSSPAADAAASISPEEIDELLQTGLIESDPIPSVLLVDANHDTTSTTQLVSGRGAVVLFIDPDCKPCAFMTQRWQNAIDKAVVSARDVIVITNRSPERNERHRMDNGYDFTIFQDVGAVFRDVYNVHAVPLEVVVGASGNIRCTTRDPGMPVDTHVLNEWPQD